MGFWGFGEQYVRFYVMYFVQLRIAPQNPKTPSIKIPINRRRKIEFFKFK